MQPPQEPEKLPAKVPDSAKKLSSGLRGLVDNSSPKVDFFTAFKQFMQAAEKIETEAYKRLTYDLNVYKADRDRLNGIITQIEKRITALNSPMYIGLVSGMGAVYYTRKQSGLVKAFSFCIGLLGGDLLEKSLDALGKEEREKELKFLKDALNENKKLRFRNERKIASKEAELKVTARFEALPVRKNETNKRLSLPILPIQKPFEGLSPDNRQQLPTKQNLDYIPNSNCSSRIINSRQLQQLDYKALNFQDRWLAFLGYPSFNFHCAVTGLAGEGKSTFCIQFANYLAVNFGRVVYISGEEGFSMTLRDKFVNTNAIDKDLDIADLRNYESIINEVPVNVYHFIFIDSLDNMHIDSDKMKQLRERYKDSALVTISQSTKDGKMRGSYEIVHDSDITIKVQDGVAVTTKNRFKEKGMQFKVFL
jgi:hypothetical protein